MDKFRLPTTVDFHLPAAFVGKVLSSSAEKESFKLIKKEIEIFYASVAYLEILMKIVDHVDETNIMGNIKSMRLIGSVINYLRIKLLSRVLHIIEMTAVLLDVLVKNCQYRVHIHVNKRIFIKTFCLVTRQLLADDRENYRRIGHLFLIIIDIFYSYSFLAGLYGNIWCRFFNIFVYKLYK
jgi:hypothetical protein